MGHGFRRCTWRASATRTAPTSRLLRGLKDVEAESERKGAQLLRDRLATKAALHVLAGTTSWGCNRVKALDAGASAVLVEMHVDAPERRVCELARAWRCVAVSADLRSTTTTRAQRRQPVSITTWSRA
ncbi:hypothetical protein EJB05_39755, partial [Eragrostis curvula]